MPAFAPQDTELVPFVNPCHIVSSLLDFSFPLIAKHKNGLPKKQGRLANPMTWNTHGTTHAPVPFLTFCGHGKERSLATASCAFWKTEQVNVTLDSVCVLINSFCLLVCLLVFCLQY